MILRERAAADLKAGGEGREGEEERAPPLPLSLPPPPPPLVFRLGFFCLFFLLVIC